MGKMIDKINECGTATVVAKPFDINLETKLWDVLSDEVWAAPLDTQYYKRSTVKKITYRVRKVDD